MAFLNGLIKVVVTYGFEGIPSINVHFVLQDTPASPIPVGELALATLAVFNAYNDEWTDFMSDSWQIDEIVATDYSLEGGDQFEKSSNLPLVGTEIAAEVPSNVCLVATKLTNRTGRSYRGRSYLAGLSEANVFGNDVDGNTQIAAAAWVIALVTELDAIDMELVVLSTRSEGVERPNWIATAVTGSVANSRVDTQRRRLD